MKENIIELVNIVGTSVLCSEIKCLEKFLTLYSDKLLRIGRKKLYDF
jgi:hypothetical protein